MILLLAFTSSFGGIFVFLILKLPLKGVSFYVFSDFSLSWTKVVVDTACVCVCVCVLDVNVWNLEWTDYSLKKEGQIFVTFKSRECG